MDSRNMDRIRGRLQVTNDTPDISRDSSISSYSTNLENSEHSEHSRYAESTNSTISRPYSVAHSFTPSYMSAAIPVRKPIKQQPSNIATGLNGHPPAQEAIPQAPQLAKGVLMVVVADKPHAETITYLGMMLKRGPYCRIVIFGCTEREKDLKQLKMDIFALLGKLSLEIGVQMELQTDWREGGIAAAMEKGLRDEDILGGVLCCPAFDYGAYANILMVEEEKFEDGWRRTVGFVRNWAKATLPILRPSPVSWEASGLFIVTETKELSPAALVNKAACDSMMGLLANTHQRLTVAYADSVLIPDPEPVEPTRTPVSAHDGAHDIYYDDYESAAESPTKLYAMWAMQDENDTIY